MSIFDFGKKRKGAAPAESVVQVIINPEVAAKFPEVVEAGQRGVTRAELAVCAACGAANRDVVVTTGGPMADADLWRDHPVALDSRQCTVCGRLAFPVALDPRRSAP